MTDGCALKTLTCMLVTHGFSLRVRMPGISRGLIVNGNERELAII